MGMILCAIVCYVCDSLRNSLAKIDKETRLIDDHIPVLSILRPIAIANGYK